MAWAVKWRSQCLLDGKQEFLVGAKRIPPLLFRTREEIRAHIGADSLGFLSIDGLMKAAGKTEDEVCAACWSEDYPVALPHAEANQLRLFDKTHR